MNLSRTLSWRKCSIPSQHLDSRRTDALSLIPSSYQGRVNVYLHRDPHSRRSCCKMAHDRSSVRAKNRSGGFAGCTTTHSRINDLQQPRQCGNLLTAVPAASKVEMDLKPSCCTDYRRWLSLLPLQHFKIAPERRRGLLSARRRTRPERQIIGLR